MSETQSYNSGQRARRAVIVMNAECADAVNKAVCERVARLSGDIERWAAYPQTTMAVEFIASLQTERRHLLDVAGTICHAVMA